ncbi:hypothetical protein ACAH01_11715 [Halomicrobium sp. HM KBTZ05]|uniref:hypothetical protein n=1 Tax=Halomicrobium sp. HM KBTZ05 TaxID=3242663 RepID=UPI0035574D55
MTANNGSDSYSSDEESIDVETDDDGSHRRTHPETVEINAYDLSVRLKSEDKELGEMVDMASTEMEALMRHSLRGEMEAIEEEQLSIFGLGDD